MAVIAITTIAAAALSVALLVHFPVDLALLRHKLDQVRIQQQVARVALPSLAWVCILVLWGIPHLRGEEHLDAGAPGFVELEVQLPDNLYMIPMHPPKGFTPILALVHHVPGSLEQLQ